MIAGVDSGMGPNARHGNAWRIRGLPSFDAQFQRHRNPDFWKHKIETNMRRDHEVTAALTAEGWRVLRFWESDLVRDFAEAADRVEAVVRQQHQSTSLAERVGR